MIMYSEEHISKALKTVRIFATPRDTAEKCRNKWYMRQLKTGM